MTVVVLKVQRTGIFRQATAPKKRGRRGELFVELAGKKGLGGAAHRNMKLDCWELEFTADNYVSLRCSF